MDNLIKERLSLSYVMAVCSRAGYEVCEIKVDVDSVDGLIVSKRGKHPVLAFQAKATSRDIVGDSGVHFSLPTKNYNDLRKPRCVPVVLILVCLHVDNAQWLCQTEDVLELRKCGYWLSLSNLPDTTNEATVTVRIPRSQVFDGTQLNELMARIEVSPEL